MRIPLYIRAPGLTRPGSKSSGLACHVDLARTIAEFGGVNVNEVPTMVGESLHSVFEDPSAAIRDHVLFAQEWAWYPGVEQCRYASSGIFDGRYKYCRYYGIGGSHDTVGNPVGEPEMLFGRDSDFEDHDHELYDLQEDPYELVNLAVDRSRRTEVRSRFGELRALERHVYGDGY